MLFKMMDAASGDDMADDFIDEYDRLAPICNTSPKINDPCPCGSGKKYKKKVLPQVTDWNRIDWNEF